MLFNSNTFLLFGAAFLLLYFLCRSSLRARNHLIVAGSYVFYGWWDYRFLALLLASSVLDFVIGLRLGSCHNPRVRQGLLFASLAGNLGILGFFKYHHFFVESLVSLLGGLGLTANFHSLNIILPVGISFYTFQSLSYSFDIYRRQMAPTRDWIHFLAYVSFFPQLVAGPIERARHLLPQFGRTLAITRGEVESGCWLMIWGLFKKVVLADNLAPLVEMVYDAPGISGPVIGLGTIAFGIQIYCDFSGYTDIARGVAKLLGFDLMVNFNLPYLAADIRDFWRRWHISLSTWLRDYLYISLGGNRQGNFRTGRNLMLTMVLGGLWHGAAWNFVLWGAWHGAGLLVNRLGDDRVKVNFPGRGIIAWLLTMLFVFYGWLLFRANSWDQIVSLTRDVWSWQFPAGSGSMLLNLIVFSAPLIAMQIWQRRSGDLEVALTLPPWLRGGFQAVLLMAVALYWNRAATPFIYFQF